MPVYYAERFFGLHPRHHSYAAARAYVLEKIRNPSKGSVFDRQTRWFRGWLPSSILLWVLRRSGRDGFLLFSDDGRVIAHVFFHAREDHRLHMFNVGVEPGFEGRGFMTILLAEHFIPHAKKTGFRGVRISAGGKGAPGQDTVRFRHDRVVRFCERLTRREVALRQGIALIPRGDYFFDFFDESAT